MSRANSKLTNWLFEIILLILFSFFLFWLPVNPKCSLSGDGQGYQILAKNIAFQGEYSLSESSPFIPTIYREPAYPYFLAFLFRLGKGSLEYINIGQMILLYITAFVAQNLACILAGPIIGVLVRLLTLFYPTLLDYTRFTLSEIMALFLFVSFAYCLVRVFQDKTLNWTLLAGFFLGILILCKAIMFYFFPIFLVTVILSFRNKRIISLVLLMSLVGYTLIFPWIIRVHNISGKWQITSGREYTSLYGRAYKLSYSWNDIKQELVFNFSERLGRKLFPSATADLVGKTYTYKAFEEMDRISNFLRKKGLDEKEIEKYLMKESIRKILAGPLKYLALSILEFEKMLAFNHFPSLNCDLGPDRDIKDTGITRILRYLYRLMGYPMFILTLYSIWVIHKNWKDFFSPIMIFLYVNVFYSFLFAEGRFNVPIIPIIILFDCIAIEYILKRIEIIFT